ncbi:MAG TPA: H-X9-DG-CTERM domain-containing protein [Tepidisphaeraceae bacterium]|jgi:prepilin-type processing-associated H-X9-DG protein/prepilin-type N-terminal cleavage/methylation domain-containing protein|nr:H-X9-DG-CTERM domain-containing protein [Tepidisphaeraceae bacterium]
MPIKRDNPRRWPRAAFTLVELLVVIGIIALLIGILLPVLGRARETAKRIACLSNLRQMAISAQNYVIDSKGFYPIAYYFASEGSRSVTYCWDLTTIDEPGQPAQVVPGLLWRSNDPTRVQQCPSFEGSSTWLVDPFTGYNYNTSFIGHGQYESIPAPAKAASIRHPSKVAMFGDGQWAVGADKFMRAPFPNPGDQDFTGRWAGTQGFRHQGRTNVAFCDGHAESLSDRFTANADDPTSVAAGTGFLSNDNSLYGPQ